MKPIYSLDELLFFAALYAFVGWALEVCLIAITQRRFSNRGFLNLPMKMSFGVTMAILLVTLPALEESTVMQVLMCIAVTEIVRRFSELFARGEGAK